MPAMQISIGVENTVLTGGEEKHDPGSDLVHGKLEAHAS
jgi:hypothetical protein